MKRCCLAVLLCLLIATKASAEFLYVSNTSLNSILRYDAATGEFIDEFVPSSGGAGTGGLTTPGPLTIGSNGNLFVTSGISPGSAARGGSVLRYDGNTGDFLGSFTEQGDGGLGNPVATIFGHDGNLLVSSQTAHSAVDVVGILRFDGSSGEFIDVFIQREDLLPGGMTFGPDGDLYMTVGPSPEFNQRNTVLRFDGHTGAFLEEFLVHAPGRTIRLGQLSFGSGGDLYLRDGDRGVSVYDGESGEYLRTFATDIVNVGAFDFGPDGNIYVAEAHGAAKIKRYDLAGNFIDDFIVTGDPHADDWLVSPNGMIFSSAVTAVPEPSSLSLCLVSLVLVTLFLNHRRSVTG